ncbi:hypothetical protein RhiirA4_519262, partial [Rhizophagus irregularis]
MFENVSGKSFIQINGEVKCKYCEKIENVTLKEINYFEVREESEEIYEVLEIIRERHEKEKHEENKEEYQRDPSCLICYKVKEDTEPEWFKKFWRIFQKVILIATSYNRNTIEKLLEYITLTRKDKDDKYILNQKKRVKELEKVKEKGEKLLDVIVVSIRHGNKPDYMQKGIISVIKIICEHYIFDKEDNLLVEEEETRENLLGNRELLEYGYIIEDDELDRRLIELEEWLEEEKITTIEYITQNTMRYFKEILHMEESIVNEESKKTVKNFQKNIKYQCQHVGYDKPWKNDNLTDKIIERIVEKEGFIRNRNDIEELESSEDESEGEKVRKLVKRLKGDEDIRTECKINIMLGRGYELGELEIDEVIRKALVDDEVDTQRLKEKLEKGELPLRVKGKAVLKDGKERAMIIATEWIEKGYVDVTIGGIMRLLKLGYDEFRLENDRRLIEKYMEYKDLLDDELMIKLDEQDELAGLKDDLEKLGYEIKNRNELEEELRKKLDKLLKEQAGIISNEGSGEKSDDEESEKEDSNDLEKVGEILSLEEHEIWEENIEDFHENESENENNNENVINTEGFGLSQNSDSNNSLNIEKSDNKSELSDYNLQDLFQENILLNMGATRAEVREDLRAALLAATGHDIGGNWAGLIPANPLANVIEDAGNVAGGMVNIPLFYGKEEEDVSDWIKQFEVAFTAIGKAAGANGIRQAAYTAAHLRGAAAQWYNEMKETNVGHLVNWADADNDNDLKHRIKRRFTRED